MGEHMYMKMASNLTLPKMTTLALKGKQSVRASFKLSEVCILAINIVATQLGIKHRSLFDYLVEDADSLEAIAREVERQNHTHMNGIQKTFIISRETLLAIDIVSKKLKVSRDALIEHSVRRLVPIIEREKECHFKRKHLFDKVRNHYMDSATLLDQIKKSLGAEDPLYKAFQNTMTTCEQIKTQINNIVEKGKIIEGFNPDSLKD